MDTDQGLMKVMRANFFRNSVTVYSDRGEELEFTLDEWEALNPRRFDPNAPRPEPVPSSEPRRPPRRGGRPGGSRDGGRPRPGRARGPQPEKRQAEDGAKPQKPEPSRDGQRDKAPVPKERNEGDAPVAERKPRKRKRRRRPRRPKKED